MVRKIIVVFMLSIVFVSVFSINAYAYNMSDFNISSLDSLYDSSIYPYVFSCCFSNGQLNVFLTNVPLVIYREKNHVYAKNDNGNEGGGNGVSFRYLKYQYNGVGYDYKGTNNTELLFLGSAVIDCWTNYDLEWQNSDAVFHVSDFIDEEITSTIIDDNNLATLTDTEIRGFWNGLNGKIDSVIEYLQSILEAIENGFESVFQWFSDLFDGLTGWFSNVISAINTAADDIVYAIEYNLNPNHEDLEGSFGDSVSTSLTTKYTFVSDIQNSLATIDDVQNTPLSISNTVNIGSYSFPVSINFSWYENYREYVRTGLSVLFEVLLALSCCRIVLGTFNVGLKTGTSAYMNDNHYSGALTGRGRKEE